LALGAHGEFREHRDKVPSYAVVSRNMPLFDMGADAEKWMKCPPETVHAAGHTGPWMGLVEKKMKHPTKMWKGEPDLDWHVRMSDGCKKVIDSKTAKLWQCPRKIEISFLHMQELQFMINKGVNGLELGGRPARHGAKKMAPEEKSAASAAKNPTLPKSARTTRAKKSGKAPTPTPVVAEKVTLSEDDASEPNTPEGGADDDSDTDTDHNATPAPVLKTPDQAVETPVPNTAGTRNSSPPSPARHVRQKFVVQRRKLLRRHSWPRRHSRRRRRFRTKGRKYLHPCRSTLALKTRRRRSAYTWFPK
jgi:hypothetical protein